ncbi:MAG: ABC transporter permease [Azospira oryzae]|jgi:putative ABC transport system permease protein|nr:MAG: ABC transporter permease [Azospira oryzae]
MFRNYFTIAWRNLVKTKGYSFINIGGLALGMSVSLIIGLWVHDELTFNRYHENYDHIAQVMKAGTFQGKHYSGQTYLQFPMLHELKTTYGANFKYVVPKQGKYEAILSVNDKKISKTGTNMGEDGPEMFTWKMMYGTRAGLKEVKSIMISASTADALFGKGDPIGKMVKIDNEADATISGVFEDFPKNSELYGIQFARPWEAYLLNNPWVKDQGWQNHFFQIYVQLQPTARFESVDASIRNLEINATRNLAYMQDWLKFNPEVHIHPMSKWHLYSDFKEGTLQNGPIQLVWFIGAIGVFVLLLACINFMNLSTARSEKRAKEVGVRKTLGSGRRQLIAQFFAESYLVVFLSFCITLLMVSAALPWFNTLSQKAMQLPWQAAPFWMTCISFLLFTGLAAGSYPAIYLSSFNPLKILKGTYRAGRFASIPRKALVVLQFTVSIMLIASTGVIYHQLMFVKDRPVGYSREGLLMMQKKGKEFYDKFETLRTELKSAGAVQEIADAGGPITTTWSGNGGFSWKGYDPNADNSFSTLNVSADFGTTVGWQVIDGRTFSRDIASDSSGIIINESAAKQMKLENPVGETVHWTNLAWNMDNDFHIVGVIHDMVMNSPFEPVRPAIYLNMGGASWMYLRINPEMSKAEALTKIEATFKKVIPSAPFDYKFAAQEYATKFSTEDNIGRLAIVFTSLAIVISCLGLFGLASFVAEQRTKEIGIRKVLGASVPNLWRMLSGEFVVLIIVACIIAVPVSYYFLYQGIRGYDYRTDIAWWIFAAASGGALAITLATVSFQAIKAALANPVKSLRTE